MEKQYITLINEDGSETKAEVLCEILFTFNSEEFNKNYVLFYPVGSEDEDGSIEVMAASYTESEDGTCGELQDVTTDEEWELIEEMLEKEIKLPVIMIDERMTSRMAHNTMLKADMSRNKRKQNVDKLAATIILQSYLDSLPKF